MKKSLHKEWKYILFSKKLVYLVITFSIVFCCSLYLNYKKLVSLIDLYNYNVEFFCETEEDLEQELLNDYYSNTDNNGVLFVSNPVRYYKEQIELKYKACSHNYVLTQCMEDCLFFFPIILTIWSALLAIYDFSSKMFRVRSVRESTGSINFSKQLVGIGSAIAAIIIATIPTMIVGVFVQKNADILCLNNSISIESKTPIETNYIAGIALIIFFSVFIFEISYSITTIVKSAIIPIVAVITYWYIVPIIGKYDPRNFITVIATKVFPFYGFITMSDTENISPLSCLIYMLIIDVFLVLLTEKLLKKRSAF